MADTFAPMYQGQLPAAMAALATADGAGWIIKLITGVNTDTVARTCGLAIKGTAAANLITGQGITLPPGGFFVWDLTLPLAPGDVIAGVASSAAKITVTISGDKLS